MQPNASKAYPLPSEEQRALRANVLATDLGLAVVGIVFAMLAQGIATNAWDQVFFAFAWLPVLGTAFAPHWSMVALPCVLLACADLGDRMVWERSAAYRADVMDLRQGVNGELPRLPLWQTVVLMAVAGFAEELAFRYGLLQLLNSVFQLIAAGPLSLAAAVVLSAGLFGVVHGQYRQAWSLGAVIVIGAVLGFAFAATGSLLVSAVAHALYNIGDVLIERRRMVRDADYFGGKPPTRVICDLEELEHLGRR